MTLRFTAKTLTKIAAFLILALYLSACAYSNVIVPLDQDVDKTEIGDKIGRSSVYSVLGLVSWGDGGVEAAAREGGLKQINHLDAEYFTVLFGIYSRVTTVAYGR